MGRAAGCVVSARDRQLPWVTAGSCEHSYDHMPPTDVAGQLGSSESAVPARLGLARRARRSLEEAVVAAGRREATGRRAAAERS